MGVSLSTLISGEEISFDTLKGKIIAIDSYNTLYQFLSTIRDRFTGEPLRDSEGRITSHLTGLFYRTIKLLEFGIKPVFVFDGKPPEFKRKTIEARIMVRAKSKEKWEAAAKKGDVEAVRRYAQGAIHLTREMVDEAKQLLGLMGVSCIQAPSEGEAQAAHLLKQGKAWAVGSQDWDSLLFGAERMVKNLTISGRRKVPRREQYIEVKPELISLKKALAGLGISREQLILLGMLVGTDYNPGGIKGIGPKTALKLVKEFPSPDRLFDEVEWSFEIQPEKIFDFFLNPPVEDLEIRKQSLDKEKLSGFMEAHDFSSERVESSVKKLEKSSEKNKQKGLGSFLG